MELTEKDKERFWKRVEKTESCWLWTGCCVNGYGQLRINRKIYLSHRVSWFLAGNTIPDGYIIRHKCRSKSCCNPEHLETGTHAENMADKIRDGTSTRGERSKTAKLTSAQVLEIRAREGERYVDLAEEFDVTKGTISNIIHRQAWKHI
jgi:hypothetical protein